MHHKLSKQKHKDFSRKQKRQPNTQELSIKEVFYHNLGHCITLLFILAGIVVIQLMDASVTDVALHTVILSSVFKFIFK